MVDTPVEIESPQLSKIIELESEISRVNTIFNRLENEISELKQSAVKLEEIKSVRISELESKINSLKTRFTEKQALSATKITELESQISQLSLDSSGEISSKQYIIADLRTEVKSLLAVVAELEESNSKQITQLNTEIASISKKANMDSAELMSTIKGKNIEIVKLVKISGTQSNEKRALLIERNQLIGESMGLSQRLSENDQKHAVVLAKHKKQLIKNEKAILLITEQLEHTGSQLDLEMELLEATKSELNLTEQELAASAKALNESAKAKAELSKSILEIRAQHKKVEVELNKKLAKISELNTTKGRISFIEQKNSIISDLHSKFKAQAKKLQKNSMQVSALMGLNTTQQDQIDVAKSKATTLSQTLASRDTDIISLNVENSMFKQILADKAKRINQLNNRISILIKQLGSTK